MTKKTKILLIIGASYGTFLVLAFFISLITGDIVEVYEPLIFLFVVVLLYMLIVWLNHKHRLKYPKPIDNTKKDKGHPIWEGFCNFLYVILKIFIGLGTVLGILFNIITFNYPALVRKIAKKDNEK